MPPVEKIGRDALELRGTRAHSVEQNDRSRTPLAVHVRTGTAAEGDTGMVASDESLEPVEAGSQGRVLKTREVHLLSEQAREFIALEERYGAHNYAPLDLVVERAQGVWLWDVSGKRYLDFIQGWAVNSLGHCNDGMIEAMDKQARTLINPSPAFYNAPMAQLAGLLTANSCFDKVFFANSGAEANEAK